MWLSPNLLIVALVKKLLRISPVAAEEHRARSKNPGRDAHKTHNNELEDIHWIVEFPADVVLESLHCRDVR